MKNVKYYFLLLFFIASHINQAQSCKTLGTTSEEYNYVAKGYKVQIESGLDMKKGYEFKDVYAAEIDGRKIVYRELIKDGKDLRAIMAIFTGKNGQTNYFCIPLGDASKEINQVYFNSINANIDNSEALNFYQFTLSRLLNKYLSE